VFATVFFNANLIDYTPNNSKNIVNVSYIPKAVRNAIMKEIRKNSNLICEVDRSLKRLSNLNACNALYINGNININMAIYQPALMKFIILFAF
jgi:hypothetical protein